MAAPAPAVAPAPLPAPAAANEVAPNRKRAPYNRISDQDRETIIHQIVNLGRSVKSVVAGSGGRFKESTVRTIMKRYHDSGLIARAPHSGGPKCKLSDEMKADMRRW